MRRVRLAGLPLRLRLALLHASPVLLLAAVLFGAVLLAFLWTLHALVELDRERAAFDAAGARRAAVRAGPAAVAVSTAASAAAADKLAAFYGALGERRDAGRQLRTLFGLAEKSGLVLRQGEYKSAFDRNAGVHTYRVDLPVRGSYESIWQFAMPRCARFPSPRWTTSACAATPSATRRWRRACA